ncbi:MAG TPA: hypothetical protein VLB44_10310 [Kofleriaceae bacterium]|nr:hypothetical protein [Kofleriaceae bacterium]
MKKLVALVALSTALAITCTACAHQQLTQRRAVRHERSIDITVLGDATALGALIETQQR